uniref:Uncharacterized protein n=1 Tax=Latimeria chalumnae TaxID=7897 RepID=H3B490_LATCH
VTAEMSAIMKEFSELRPSVTSGNLTRKNISSLIDFRHNDEIIIKPTDKGGAVVIWGKTDYIAAANRQLGDGSTYKVDNVVRTEQYCEDIHVFVCDAWAQGTISQETCERLIPKELSLGRCYLLPKIHKNKTHCPGRPIVSGNGSYTEGISRFVDDCLKEIATGVPTHLRDTIHF